MKNEKAADPGLLPWRRWIENFDKNDLKTVFYKDSRLPGHRRFAVELWSKAALQTVSPDEATAYQERCEQRFNMLLAQCPRQQYRYTHSAPPHMRAHYPIHSRFVQAMSETAAAYEK